MYDLVIIGAGPAGLAAGLYGARAKMKTLVLEKEKKGGQIVVTSEVENYPGSVENATGPSLTKRFADQVEHFGAEIKKANVKDINLDSKIKEVICDDETYKAKAVILATGASPRKLGCTGEKEFTGKGVSYCATCDADFFEDFEVIVVGGGDSALEEAMYLTKFARKVYLVHRKDTFKAAKSIVEKAQANDKIEFWLNKEIIEIKGDGILESVLLKDTVTGETSEYVADEDDGTMGVFIFVGLIPQTSLFEGKINLENGYIVTDTEMRTNIEGVYAAGDVRVKTLRQVVTAAADGAIAAVTAEKYIDEHFE
ncbi:thioredoxin-disulfide reductase [Miniphocaeibacter massiliensis]|uniref:thioredoxin-disulfide reductase n=1 Tax=Miniphocaeibacter massiliensis TaxID=2041841 RepID=UPI001A91B81C|nr:thioredoxin-disulfide reductase [Miniphocaeibacter massiliensis]